MRVFTLVIVPIAAGRPPANLVVEAESFDQIVDHIEVTGRIDGHETNGKRMLWYKSMIGGIGIVDEEVKGIFTRSSLITPRNSN